MNLLLITLYFIIGFLAIATLFVLSFLADYYLILSHKK